MNGINISILQKSFHTGYSSELKLKITNARSNFLLIPIYFPSEEPLKFSEREALRHIFPFSDYSKVVVIGGSLTRVENDKFYFSSPIIKELQVIDYYDKKILNQDEKIFGFSEGIHESIFIMNSVRFLICMGEEIDHPKIRELIKKENIKLIFHLDETKKDGALKYKDEIEKFDSLSKELNLSILRICGFGKKLGKNYIGRSLYTTPKGIAWKVSESEEEKEVFKLIQLKFDYKNL